MNQKHYLIKGTLLLTVMGLLARFAGFFYKIFLSRTIGAAQIGLYQLAIPVYSFCTALSGGGVQSAISKFVAEYRAREDLKGARKILIAGLFLSVSSSLLIFAVLYFCAPLVAGTFLHEDSCTILLKLMAFSLPFQMVSSCICGYFMGIKRIVPPALAQILEQLARIATVLFLYTLSIKNGTEPGAALMIFGQIAGEAVSAAYCAGCICLSGRRDFRKKHCHQNESPQKEFHRLLPVLKRFQHITKWLPDARRSLLFSARRILTVSAPLGLNRMLLCVLQAIEAALLPLMLRRAGMTSIEALSVYGTLTGMSLPMILFPTAVTSALGMLLLPAVSEAQALHKDTQLAGTVNATFLGSLLIGSFCLGAFLLFGEALGTTVFHSRLAGIYIRRLAFICPFFYISGTLMSVLHGLGKSSRILVWNLLGFLLRFLCIIGLVPAEGMNGYLCGMLLDELLLTVCILFSLRQYGILTMAIPDTLIRTLLPALLGGGAAFLFLLFWGQKIPAPACLLAGGGIYCMLFFLCTIVTLPYSHRYGERSI